MAIFGRKKKAEAEKAAASAAVAAETDEKNGRDSPESASTQGPKGNPFATPRFSEPPSRDPQESEGSGYFPPVQTTSYVPRRRKFVSARLKEGEFDEKPWVRGKDDPNYKRRRWEKAMFWICIGVGILIGAAICAFEYINVSTGDFCQIWQDDFKNIDSSSWSYELQRGGFGTGSFEWAVNDPKNAYVDAAGLHIVPTITVDSTDITPDQLMDGYVINNTLTDCTSKDYTMCSIRSNKTSGDIINPVRSARLVTRGKRSIKYGRVEVVAKMPRGDWLWPAIWMMPEGSDGSGQYGAWPQSGEIDIAESRGNSPENYTDGRNSIISALHWGPTPMTDAFWRTSGKHNVKRTDYAAAFHTYGLEWTKDYLFTYIDSKLLQVFFLKFSQGPSTMWQRGDFGTMLANKSALNNPWLTSVSQQNAPFDQPFYLILNVAVGSTNGFFPDQKSNKPWGDGSLTAPAQFYAARNSWEPTWGAGDARGMTVKSVKMWKEGKCT